jgi:hypothetical protein
MGECRDPDRKERQNEDGPKGSSSPNLQLPVKHSTIASGGIA